MEFQDTRNEHFMRLYEPHHASAMAYARRLTGNDDKARDLLQDSLEIALRSFAGLRNAGSFKPWFYRVMRNRHLNKARRAKLASRFNFSFDIERGAGIDESAVERAHLFAALDQLSPEQREALILFEVEGLSVKDIAMVQGRSAAAVKYRLRRGRQKLTDAYFSDAPPSAKAVPVKDD